MATNSWPRRAKPAPAAGEEIVDRKKRKRRLPKVVRKPEWSRLLDATTSQRDRALIALMLYGGLRVSEACALRVRDVDFEGEQVHILHGKGDKEAYVYVHSDALDEVRTLLTERGKPAPGDPVFRSKKGGALSRAQAWRIVKAVGEATGIGAFENDAGDADNWLSPHKMRHSCATRMLERGANLRVVQDHMRHASIATTEIYTHIANPELKRAAQDM